MKTVQYKTKERSIGLLSSMQTYITCAKLLLLAVSLFFVSDVHCQHLKRKGSLGVGYYTVIPDSLMKQLKLKDEKGALINFVVPASTAEMLKLKPLDLVTRVNGKSIATPADLLSAAQNLKEGDDVSVTFLRQHNYRTVKGKVKGKPRETSPVADVYYDEFPFDGGYARTIYKKPKGRSLATVFYLQGISCYSLEYLPATDPYKKMCEALLSKGYSVFVVEKPGAGDSQTETPCAQMGFRKEVEFFRAAYSKLLTIQGVDTSNIFLFGHSLGGIIAPLLAQEFEPKGVMVYGTGLRPWYDYILNAIRMQEVWGGGDLATVQDSLEKAKPTLYELFYNGKSASELSKNGDHLRMLQYAMAYDTATGLALAGRTPQYHVEINKTNLPQAWKKVNGYVLAMYGGGDVASLYPDDHEAIVEYVNKNSPGKATYLFVPNTNHTFQETGSIADYYKMQTDPKQYEKLGTESFNMKLADKIGEWLLDKVGR